MSRVMPAKLPAALVAAALAAALSACEEEAYVDHSPPEGQGSLVIDNNSADTLLVLVNAATNLLVESGGYGIMDLAPDLYDVRIEESDEADRTFEDNVRVEEHELLILHVFTHPTDRDEYTVVDERR